MSFKARVFLSLLFLLPVISKGRFCIASERIKEKLDRGVIAFPRGDGSVYVGWRLLSTDPQGIAFNVYRRWPDGLQERLNDKPITKTCDFIDTRPRDKPGELGYFVRPIVGGKELLRSRAAGIDRSGGGKFRRIKLKGRYTFQKVGIADLDGDGRYDFVIKQPNENIDPYVRYWRRSPGTYKLEAYLSDGTFLWRYDLSWAIERGIWYSPYVVYDLDGDGKAEVACKIGEGDPRGPDGRVQSGPEYLAILDGMTGKVITKTAWIPRSLFKGPRAYNFASRNQLCVAYLDGKNPYLIMERGTYGLIVLVAFRYSQGQLREVWRWSNDKEPRSFWGQGAHWMHAADVDQDGREEIVIGSAVVDDNGKGLWSTGLGHPDHAYVGDIDYERPGLEIYYGIEPRHDRNGMCLVDAKTGRIIWGHQEPTRHIHSSGLCADIDLRYPGRECYSGERDFPEKRWLRTCKGKILAMIDLGGLAPRAAFFDGDLAREIIRGGKLIKFGKGSLDVKIEGHIAAVADILGDWREEIVTSVPGELRIYTTTIPATDRRPCLMEDPIYRSDVTCAAMGYFQIPLTLKPLQAMKR